MARAIWTGVISFGLVSVPVGLYSATEEHEITFNQFEKGTSDRVRYKRVNERTGDEVAYSDIVKGHDVGGGEYVIVEPDELAAVAPGRSRSLEIHTFVDLDQIDPIYYQKTYYLAPASPESARTYALLRDAMANTHRAAIATFVMRSKEYLAAIRPNGDVLALETMYFADEVRDPHKELPALPDDAKPRPQEVTMAEQLVTSMTAPWRPEDYHDTYTERVRDLIETKRKGGDVVAEAEAPQATNVVDLLSALRDSVEAAKRRRGESGDSDSDSRTAKRSGGRAGAGGSGEAGGSGRRTAKGSDVDLATLTKSELDAMARELKVPGRSKMNRDELAEAVGAARGSSAGGRKKAS